MVGFDKEQLRVDGGLNSGPNATVLGRRAPTSLVFHPTQSNLLTDSHSEVHEIHRVSWPPPEEVL